MWIDRSFDESATASASNRSRIYRRGDICCGTGANGTSVGTCGPCGTIGQCGRACLGDGRRGDGRGHSEQGRRRESSSGERITGKRGKTRGWRGNGDDTQMQHSGTRSSWQFPQPDSTSSEPSKSALLYLIPSFPAPLPLLGFVYTRGEVTGLRD